MQCPDCDSVKMFRDPPDGNGECSACHGSGFVVFIYAALGGVPERGMPDCEDCNGSGKCQTCGGTGVIEEPEIKIAA